MQGMIGSLLQQLFNVYDAFTVAFFLCEGDTLVCHSHSTLSQGFLINCRIPVEGSLPGWALKHNEILIIPNFDKDESTLGYYGKTEDIKSFIAYPMNTKGVIVIDCKRKYAFTDKEKKILGGFVTFLGDLLEREEKTSDIDERIEELFLQRRIIGLMGNKELSSTPISDVLSECIRFTGADVSFVVLDKNGKLVLTDICGISEENYRERECPAGTSIVSLIVDGGRELILPHDSGYLRERPVLFPEETLKPRQLFGFPLTFDDKYFGVVGFLSQSERPLNEGAIGLMRDVAALLSLHFRSIWMEESLAQTKRIDPMTGMMQFALFLEHIEAEIDRRHSFSLLSIHLDLQGLNKEVGISLTNDVVARVAEIVRYCAGTGAVMGYRGGGHFYVLLYDATDIESKNILKLTHYSITKSIAKDGGGENAPSLRSGISRFPEHSRDIWELFDIAEGNTKSKLSLKEVGE